MAGRFTKIPRDTFDALQTDAGVLLKRFNPANPVFDLDDIVCATTGGINPSCVPTYSDMFEDVDNAPNNTMEGKHLDGWDCKIATTGLGTSPELIRLSLGAADVDGTKVTPRMRIKLTDFTDLWWVGDKANGGFVAVRLMNALSTGGFSLQTTKNGKGTVALDITGHVSINAQDVVPMEFYSVDGDTEFYEVKQILSHITSSYTESGVEAGGALSVTLTADEDYTIENAIVTMGGEDITETAYSAGTVTIAEATGDIMIIATATTE